MIPPLPETPHASCAAYLKAAGSELPTTDATLTNEPYAVSTPRKDERGSHPVSMMSDGAILNPMGRFTPDTLHLLHRRLVPGP